MNNCFLCSGLDDRGGRIEIGNGFALVADAAPLVKGHALFCTTAHVNGLARIGAQKLIFVREKLRNIMKLLSEDNEEFLLFEHGSALDSMTPSGCVDHAHIHVLPLGELGLRSSDILEAFPRNLVEVGQAIDFEQLAEFSNRDYFWVSNQGLRPRLLMPRKIERQILRQIIASALSLQTYLTWDLYDIEAANVTTQNWRERRSREGLIL